MTPAARGDLQSLPLRTAPHPPYSNYEASNYLLSWLSPAGTPSLATRKWPGRSTVPSRARLSPSAEPPRCPSRRSPVRLRRVRLPGPPLAATSVAPAPRPATHPLRRLRLLPEAPCPLPSRSRSPGPPGSRGSFPHPQVRAPLGPARWRRPRRARRADGTPRAPGRDWPGGEGRRAEKMAPPPAAAPRSGAC